MRKVRIQEGALFDVEQDDYILCWLHTAEHSACSVKCAAFTRVMMQSPDGRQEQAAVCAAVPQMLPIGSLGEPSNIVVATSGVVTPLKR
jgi:hypothetical protein